MKKDYGCETAQSLPIQGLIASYVTDGKRATKDKLYQKPGTEEVLIKSESKWILTACPAFVSEELWNTCNAILDEREVSRKPCSRVTVQLFSGILTCHCGGKMYSLPKLKNTSPANARKQRLIKTTSSKSITNTSNRSCSPNKI